MDVDSDNELLTKLSAGGSLDRGAWPELRADIIARLDKIAHEEFPIPKLPLPRPTTLPEVDSEGRLVSLPSSPPEASSQEANKENAPGPEPPQRPAVQDLEAGQLPKQVDDSLNGIITHLQSFHTHPPHTIQRLAELVLRPRAHYKALAPYLHAVDRIVMVTSGTEIYPLPPTDMGSDDDDPAASVAWSNPTSAMPGTDEALGGALLTPIPWLTKRSPEDPASNGGGSTPSAGETAQGVQIHSESTETIDGPNGMGSIETVSVSVNGIPSTGHTRGITQGELLRQEQCAGVVPVSQLSRSQEPSSGAEGDRGGEEPGEAERAAEEDADQEEEEAPHARGPEEIGVGDTGPQSVTTSYVGEGGLETQTIDVEAAVGRKHDEEEAEEGEKQDGSDNGSPASGADSAGTKREAEAGLESEPAKKIKEDGADVPRTEEGEPETKDDDGGRMETDN